MGSVRVVGIVLRKIILQELDGDVDGLVIGSPHLLADFLLHLVLLDRLVDAFGLLECALHLVDSLLFDLSPLLFHLAQFFFGPLLPELLTLFLFDALCGHHTEEFCPALVVIVQYPIFRLFGHVQCSSGVIVVKYLREGREQDAATERRVEANHPGHPKPVETTRQLDLRGVRPEVGRCANLGARWASVNNGVFICIYCAGVHRGIGVDKSFVRSVDLDSWDAKQLALMQRGGNARFISLLQEYNMLLKMEPRKRYSMLAVYYYKRLVSTLGLFCFKSGWPNFSWRAKWREGNRPKSRIWKTAGKSLKMKRIPFLSCNEKMESLGMKDLC